MYDKLIGNLFSSFIVHGHISLDMLLGVINPTVKDRHGNLGDSNNYRPVMSSSVFLKLFEYCLLEKIESFINLNDRQHGFRSQYSTGTACFVLKETVLNYTNSCSNVYSCFIDISKAFDSVNHNILMGKLIKYGIPDVYVNVIKHWYSNQIVKVRYGNKFSEDWKVCNGVRQGGVLSGLLFNIYIDTMLDKISNAKVGCELGPIKSNIIAYADDVVLLAPSPTSLQILIDIADNEAKTLQLTFNISKSKCMIFKHPKDKTIIKRSFIIGGNNMETVKSFKYLGYIINDKLSNSDDIDRARDVFYREFNCILRKFSFADIKVKLYLFRQYCLQFYGSELWFSNYQSSGSFKSLSIGYHKAIKKILGLSYHESNHFACQEAQLLTFENLFNKIHIFGTLRLLIKPCNFIRRSAGFLSVYSVSHKETYRMLSSKHEIESLLENDRSAIISRISYVQNHESQMRTRWQ